MIHLLVIFHVASNITFVNVQYVSQFLFKSENPDEFLTLIWRKVFYTYKHSLISADMYEYFKSETYNNFGWDGFR